MDFPEKSPPFHYEHVVESISASHAFDEHFLQHIDVIARRSPASLVKDQGKRLETALQVKQQAFETMERLHGWCSKEKAALLIDMILTCKPSIVVEIGVFGGKSLIPMAYALKALRKGTIYGIDPWSADKSAEGMDPVSKEWWSKVDHDHVLNTLLEEVYACELEDTVRLLRATSEDSPTIPNIGLLHIDGNHSEATSYIDVTKWVPLVKPGGVIIFDDINWATTSAATTWLDKRCTKIAEFQGENIWGVWIKNSAR